MASVSSRKSLDSAKASGSILPVTVVEAASSNVSPDVIEAAALKKLVSLGNRWKEILSDENGDYICEPPTLFAVICTWRVVGFAAYEIDTVNDDGLPFLRTILTFDFSKHGHDVWNSLGIAIFGNHVRDELSTVSDLAGFGTAEEAAPSDDPDA